MEPTPVFLPGKSHGKRSLVGYSLCGQEESDMTERIPNPLVNAGGPQGLAKFSLGWMLG